jgi:hypothetical protein
MLKQMARRAFLRGAGTAALAAPIAAKAAVNNAMAQHTGGALGSVLQQPPSAPAAINTPPELQALYDLSQKRQERAQQLVAYRDGHFDADIAALRSLPHASKVRMQQARDDAFKAANRTIFEQISEWQSKLWGGSDVAQSAVRLGQRILG